jgi:hypothetical protein
VEAFLHALLSDECKSLRSLDVSNKSEGNCAKQVGLAHRTARRQEGLPAFVLCPRYLACSHSVSPCPSSLSSFADSTVQLPCLAPRLSRTLRTEPGAVYLSSDGLASGWEWFARHKSGRVEDAVARLPRLRPGCWLTADFPDVR